MSNVKTQSSKIKNTILDLARVIHDAVEDTKAIDPVVLDLRKKAAYADYLLICSGASCRQVQAIADNVEEAVKKKLNRHCRGTEGYQQGTWVLLDYGDVVCHTFLEEARDFYQLENLWHDAKRVNLNRKKTDASPKHPRRRKG
ncbi:MAG: ribosome silencing factor [Deltaproteobacteria bacterium]|nr:ribosome silencing factor [Deltaproteobacteria bacterium]